VMATSFSCQILALFKCSGSESRPGRPVIIPAESDMGSVKYS
jgi:hypothetical protein